MHKGTGCAAAWWCAQIDGVHTKGIGRVCRSVVVRTKAQRVDWKERRGLKPCTMMDQLMRC
jgi:hypothetical protein